jgi:hypothetical protein
MLLTITDKLGRWDPTLMSGASEEGEIAFNGFYKSALEMIRVASIVESEDIGALIRENVGPLFFKVF